MGQEYVFITFSDLLPVTLRTASFMPLVVYVYWYSFLVLSIPYSNLRLTPHFFIPVRRNPQGWPWYAPFSVSRTTIHLEMLCYVFWLLDHVSCGCVTLPTYDIVHVSSIAEMMHIMFNDIPLWSCCTVAYCRLQVPLCPMGFFIFNLFVDLFYSREVFIFPDAFCNFWIYLYPPCSFLLHSIH